MSDYEAPAAYRYASPEFNVTATYHPKCLIEEMVDRHALSPEALNRPRVPDDIAALRERLAAPVPVTRIGPKQTT